MATNIGWAYNPALVHIPTLMLAGTNGDFETKLVIPIEKMQETYRKLAGMKVMARKKNCEHGHMLYSADGYVTAWFMWQLKNDRKAAKAFVGVQVSILVAFEDHHDFLECCVAGSLANSVDGHFHLPCPIPYAFESVGSGHSQVVVAMRGNHCLVYAIHMLKEVFYLGSIFLGQAVTCGVRNIHHRGAGLDHGFDHLVLVGLVALDELAVLLEAVVLALGVLHQCEILGTVVESLWLREHSVVDEEFDVVPFLLKFLSVALEDSLQAVGDLLLDVCRNLLHVRIALQIAAADIQRDVGRVDDTVEQGEEVGDGTLHKR